MTYQDQEDAHNRRRAAAEAELRAGRGDLREGPEHPARSAAWMRLRGWLDDLHEYAIERAQQV